MINNRRRLKEGAEIIIIPEAGRGAKTVVVAAAGTGAGNIFEIVSSFVISGLNGITFRFR